MKKELKYLLLLVCAALIYLLFKLFAPRDFDWTITFNAEDKNPFGGYVLHSLIGDIFPDRQILHSYKTIYELYDSVDTPVNFLSISMDFAPEKQDVIALLKNIERGGNAFISAWDIYGTFGDTLTLTTSDYYYHAEGYSIYMNQHDTATLAFANPDLYDSARYSYPRNNIHHYFESFDSLQSTVIAVNDLGLPVSIRVPWGKGNLFINTTPLAFSNAYLLHGDNPEFVAVSLSHLPPNDLIWTEFYQLGRAEVQSPLRFILTTEPLRWAYYLTITAILVFMFFEAKRRQRIIPVIRPLTNTSLEFVSTIGNLYLQNADHKDIADKKIAFFLEHIRTTYWLNTHTITPDFIMSLAKRSGNSPEKVKDVFSMIERIQTREQITAEELVALNKVLEGLEG